MNDLRPAGEWTIGELARRTGLNVSAIRYYEEVGLIAPPRRRASGHRVYGTAAQEVLTLIRRCRDFGFSIEETRALVTLARSDDRDCVEAREIAQEQLKAVRARLLELRTLEQSLARFVTSCTNTCAGGPAPRCTILSDLRVAPLAAAPAGCC
jgi:DNA-binding transcriptional MerR regulator